MRTGGRYRLDTRRVPAREPSTQGAFTKRSRPLPAPLRTTFESRFEHDFSTVRVHTDGPAADAADALGVRAYTVGRDIAFARGEYAPATPAGRLLVAHELAHVVQQRRNRSAPQALDHGAGEAEADRAARQAVAGGQVGPLRIAFGGLQAKDGGGVRSPVFEETVTQVSTVLGAVQGRGLLPAELRLVEAVFGASLDFDRVRIIETDVLQYRTVGNVIRVPRHFTVAAPDMAQTLVHEMTHVWQYQHAGTAYLSRSLADQITASVRTGTRNAAYEYTIHPGASFFDFGPERQAFLVENYFRMLRDQRAPASVSQLESNHLAPQGWRYPLSRAGRMAEIARELPLHEPLIAQMRAALPRSEQELLHARASEVMQMPGSDFLPRGEPLQPVPLKPVLEVRF